MSYVRKGRKKKNSHPSNVITTVTWFRFFLFRYQIHPAFRPVAKKLKGNIERAEIEIYYGRKEEIKNKNTSTKRLKKNKHFHHLHVLCMRVLKEKIITIKRKLECSIRMMNGGKNKRKERKIPEAFGRIDT